MFKFKFKNSHLFSNFKFKNSMCSILKPKEAEKEKNPLSDHSLWNAKCTNYNEKFTSLVNELGFELVFTKQLLCPVQHHTFFL